MDGLRLKFFPHKARPGPLFLFEESKKMNHALRVLGALLLLGGCVTTPPMQQTLTSDNSPESNVAYITGAFSRENSGGFALVVRNMESNTEFSMPLGRNPNQTFVKDQIVTIQVPPGRYTAAEWFTYAHVSGTSGKHPITSKLLSTPFIARAGSVTYLGKFNLEAEIAGRQVYYSIKPQPIRAREAEAAFRSAHPRFMHNEFFCIMCMDAALATNGVISPTEELLKRKEEEIAKRIMEENRKGPKLSYITPSTKEVGYAMYYEQVKQRIEKIGTLNFPQKDGKKLYGELVVSIPIFQDGSIYEKQGGPKIEHGSGNAYLDRSALLIARRSAPFPSFPKKMRSPDKEDVWVVYSRFRFTREDDTVETNLVDDARQ